MFASGALHKLIQTQSWVSVESRIVSHPAEVRKLAECEALNDPLKKSKALPLHHAVAQNPPKQVVVKLMDSYDKAITTTETAYHRTVLHLACMNRADASIIESVIGRYPAAVKIQDDLKRLPIHYAIANGCKMSTLNLLLKEFPESAAVSDHRNWLPLHIACGMRAPLKIVKLLYSQYPEGVLVLDEDGHAPMALAKRDNIPKLAVDMEVVRFLEDVTKAEREKHGVSDSDVVVMGVAKATKKQSKTPKKGFIRRARA